MAGEAGSRNVLEHRQESVLKQDTVRRLPQKDNQTRNVALKPGNTTVSFEEGPGAEALPEPGDTCSPGDTRSPGDPRDP